MENGEVFDLHLSLGTDGCCKNWHLCWYYVDTMPVQEPIWKRGREMQQIELDWGCVCGILHLGAYRVRYSSRCCLWLCYYDGQWWTLAFCFWEVTSRHSWEKRAINESIDIWMMSYHAVSSGFVPVTWAMVEGYCTTSNKGKMTPTSSYMELHWQQNTIQSSERQSNQSPKLYMYQ